MCLTIKCATPAFSANHVLVSSFSFMVQVSMVIRIKYTLQMELEYRY